MDNQLFSRSNTYQMRGIAILMVVASHYAEWWLWFHEQTTGAGELFRFACTKLGVYGVDIFFLFTGYAMVKALGTGSVDRKFVWKRIKEIYLPYLLIVGVIELVSGGFTDIKDFIDYLSGHDYWFMQVLFIMNLAFFIIWRLCKKWRMVRVLVFAAFVYGYSYYLCSSGSQDFWYLSNMAMAIGVFLGEYESLLQKPLQKIKIPLLLLTGVLMYFVVRTALVPGEWFVIETESLKLRIELAASLVWILCTIAITMIIPFTSKAFGFIGKQSLYIYLIHTAAFIYCVNHMSLPYGVRFAVSFVATILLAWVVHWLVTKLGGIRRHGKSV